MKKEIIWKEIFGFGGKYLISNEGTVKSLMLRKEKIIIPSLNKGYKILGLTDENKQRKTFRVHRLVALSFLENDNPEINTEVHHKDGNTLNNNVENLEWCNHITNCQKDFIMGNRKNQKNTPDDIKEIRNLYDNGKCTRKELMVKFNLCESTICDIINKKKWGYL